MYYVRREVELERAMILAGAHKLNMYLVRFAWLGFDTKLLCLPLEYLVQRRKPHNPFE